MEHEFWHSRWEDNAIAFHEGRVNAALARQFERLATPSGATVFVPLCGKAYDMIWLREQGHPVLGVELSPIAVRDFFTENGIACVESDAAPFTRLTGGGFTLLCGDFFDLTREHLSDVGAVYDRASLVALPPDMRGDYVRHLLSILDPRAPVLTITFEYREHEMDGPPFSVGEAEVRARFGSSRAVERLETYEIIERAPKLRERGLTEVHEHAFLISPKSSPK